MAMTAPPIPDADPASAHFFTALDNGRLEILRCRKCATPHLAVQVCDVCGGTEMVPEAASGTGTIYSFTLSHIAHHPAFAEQLPFCGGIVELSEGPRLFAPLLGSGPFAVGAVVTFERQTSDGRGYAAFRLTPQLAE
jgi:uncharacterized protein